jgi:thermitase
MKCMKHVCGARVSVLVFLVVVILAQETIIFFNPYSRGMMEESPWYEQWPFYANNAEFLSGGICNFAYDGSRVELVVGLRHGEGSFQALASLFAQKNGYITNRFSLEYSTRSVVVSVPTAEVSQVLAYLLSNENVKYVEPNWKFSIDAVPNDPAWVDQWGPAKVEADAAWDVQKGNKSVLVAVVDTGIYYMHPDLAANYVSLGYDWVNNDSDPLDDHGHGTHCAGTIAAVTNNSVGISGIAQVGVMAEKGLAYNGVGYEDDLANAIVHAADAGAKIISCSWGSSSDSQLIHDAVQYATNAGALVIAAAGNSGTSEKHYPAAYPEVIAVTATNERDKLAGFSSFGDWVDVAAPGTSIYSTYLWNSYVSLSGTSMACPHVAGVAALVWSEFPSMTNEQVRSQLLNTADDLGASGFDVYYGYGRVNARKAMAQSISLVGSRIINAPANSTYFLYINPSEGGSAETAYDVIAGGIFYGLCENPQVQSFTSGGSVLLASGEVNASAVSGASVVFFGGPCPQGSVRYYEDAGLAPLRFVANATYFMLVNKANVTVGVLSRAVVADGHEDLFAVEVFMDKTNLIVVIYGFSWKGTWAGGIYFKEVVSKNLNAYAENCYVFHWKDKGKKKDGIPQSSEIHQEYP